MQFMTSDGYRLTKVGTQWTNGDLTCESDADGHPIDCFGDRFEGEYAEGLQAFEFGEICDDCTLAVENGDYTGTDADRANLLAYLKTL